MSTEPFLINPVHKVRQRCKRNPLGEEVLMLSNAWYDDAGGHRRAARKGWRSKSRRRRKPVRHKKKGSVTLHAKSRKRSLAAKKAWRTRRRKPSIRRSVVSSSASYPMRRYSMNPMPVRRRKRRKAYASTVRRRRYRRNPATLSINGLRRSIKGTLPLAITGGISIVATKVTPGLVGVYGEYKTIGVQAATAFGGGMLVSKFVNRQHGMIWTISGAATIVADLIQKYLLGRILPGAALSGANMGAFPNEVGAFPDEAPIQPVGDGYGDNPYSDSGYGNELQY